MDPIKALGSTAPLSADQQAALKKLHDAATQLEGVFVGMLLKEMHSTVQSDGIFGPQSNADKTWNDMLDEKRADAIAKTETAKDAVPALLPIGLGTHGGEFDKVMLDTFQLIVLRGQPVRAALDRQAEALKRVIDLTGAPCWTPDAPSKGPCPVH